MHRMDGTNTAGRIIINLFRPESDLRPWTLGVADVGVTLGDVEVTFEDEGI